jgi:regulator of protease activity HflC (stomatin/prohibitin superfamily)
MSTPDPAAKTEGAWAQAAQLAFRFLFLVVFVLAVGWAISNCRRVPPDSRAIVLRFGTVVRQARAGLLLALPQPFERVILLPSADRQIQFRIDAFQGAGGPVSLSSVSGASSESVAVSISANPRDNAGILLTGDMSLVHLSATLFYQITDANAYVLSSEHVAPGLARLFTASAVSVAARRDLDTILVARPERNSASDAFRLGRESLRSDLMNEVNRRLSDLASQGASLGISISRVDLLPSIPAEAKAAFDSVLYAMQNAETAIAQARTQAEILTQRSNQGRDRILTDAQALAQERITQARTRTDAISALSANREGLSGQMLERQLYQEQIGKILGAAGRVYSADAEGGARVIVPAGAESAP